MTDRPDLAALLEHPARAAEVAPEQVPALLAALASEQARLAALEAGLAARLLTATNGHGGEDRLLKIDEAAERLGVTEDWLRRRPALPFVVKLSDGVVRYSSRGIDHYIATRVGKALASDT
jgi:predicted DNA-binding transcriptional regulator AlpA